MKTSITKTFEFEAAHHLPWHEGKCHRLHGHSYKLEVTITGDVYQDVAGFPLSGMIADFADISRIVKSNIIELLDHHDLNDIIENPTAERIAEWIWLRLTVVPNQISEMLTKIVLWETSTGYVTIERD